MDDIYVKFEAYIIVAMYRFVSCTCSECLNLSPMLTTEKKTL